MFNAYLKQSAALFFILSFVFIPLTFFGFDFQSRFTALLFTRPVAFLQDHFFANALKYIDFSSDTIALNLLLFLLLIIAFIAVGVMRIFKLKSAKIIAVFKFVAVYYLAAILLKYGFDKVFKRQFYLPEPNILYSNFGSLNKDILFWSTIGLSHTYSVVTGCVEVLTALLILIRRTRVLGFCISIGVFANILLLNISFDISVKTFTLLLLAIAVANIYPDLKSLYRFFILRQSAQLPVNPQQNKRTYYIGISLSIALLGFTLIPYLASGNFDDDKTPRPYLHGAYQIELFKMGSDTADVSDFPYKRLFIHRNSYIIFQRQDDSMADYYFDMNTHTNTLTLHDYKGNKISIIYNYNPQKGELRLNFANQNKWVIISKQLNWQALPALQDDFHYTIDEIR